MAGNSRPRKAYKPKDVKASNIMFGISEEHTRMLKLVPHAELTKLQNGVATEEAWHTITCRLNFGMVLARTYAFSVDLQPAMRGSLDCMVILMERFKSIGKLICRGDELRSIGAGLTYTDEMQEATTRRQHRDALRIVLKEST